MFGSFITRLEHLFVASVLFLSVCMSFYSLQLLLACKPGVNEPRICEHFVYSLSDSPQWMAAGESGASGRRVVQTARDSAAESVRRRSQNTEDACATGWRWLQTTAPAASAHRVGNISWVTTRKKS